MLYGLTEPLANSGNSLVNAGRYGAPDAVNRCGSSQHTRLDNTRCNDQIAGCLNSGFEAQIRYSTHKVLGLYNLTYCFNWTYIGVLTCWVTIWVTLGCGALPLDTPKTHRGELCATPSDGGR